MQYPGKIRIIAGRLRGRVINVLNETSLRPTPDRVRETLFNWLHPKILQARCLDCFSGTGILGFEALSRGAQQVTMLDRSSSVISALKKTRSDFKIDEAQCEIMHQDITQWLIMQAAKKGYLPYNIFFLDPPFDTNLLSTTLDLLANHNLLAPDAWVYVEMPVEAASSIPLTGWAPFKSKIAGKVGYHLLAKI